MRSSPSPDHSCAARQAAFGPPAALPFLPNDPPGLLLARFLTLCPIMILPDTLRHLPQQFLAESFIPKTPAPPQRFVLFRPVLRLAALFHLPPKLTPSFLAVARNPMLPPTAARFASSRAGCRAKPNATGNCSTDTSAGVAPPPTSFARTGFKGTSSRLFPKAFNYQW
jgi:hypothetical protein